MRIRSKSIPPNGRKNYQHKKESALLLVCQPVVRIVEGNNLKRQWKIRQKSQKIARVRDQPYDPAKTIIFDIFKIVGQIWTQQFSRKIYKYLSPL